MPTAPPTSTDYVYIEEDGSARELEPDEVGYLHKAFQGADGARPYIKSSYEQLTPDKRPVGYLLRAKLPAGVPVKPLSEATPVETAEAAIRIAKSVIPAMFAVASGSRLVRVVGASGRPEFGLPGLDVAFGEFSATLSAGVWRVVRRPDPSRAAVEQGCFAEISAASGRIIRCGPLAAPTSAMPRMTGPRPVRRPWWRFWT